MIYQLSFYVIRSFLPSLPGECRHTDPGIESPPEYCSKSALHKGFLSTFYCGDSHSEMENPWPREGRERAYKGVKKVLYVLSTDPPHGR